MCFIRVVLILLAYGSLWAAKPLYHITPVNSPVVYVPLSYKGYIDYLVVNQSKREQTLKFQKKIGVAQIEQPGHCSNPFTLAPNASCILNLEVNGDKITRSGTIGGPEVCSLYSDFFCSQPQTDNQLSVYILKYLYVLVANNGTNNDGYLSYCTIGASGSLENCKTFSNNHIQMANGAAITRNGFVYTANQNTNSITVCSPATDPTHMTCADYDSGGIFQSPRTAYINNGYFYTYNYDNNSVIKCDLNSNTGEPVNCVITGGGFSGPLGSMVISNGYAYIPNSSNNTISICHVNANNGNLDNCSLFSNSAFASPSGIAISGSYAYIISVWNNGVVACEVNQYNGSLSNCVNNYVLNASTPSGLNIIDGYVYVNANQPNQITKCTLGGKGMVSDCVSTGSGFDGPSGNIAFVVSQT